MLTKDNHLGAIFRTEPQKASNLMVELLAFTRGKTLESLLNSLPTREFDTSDEYTWEVIGSTRQNIPLIEARDEDGELVTADRTTNVGAGTAPFELVFGQDWFADGEKFAIIIW